jgi:hypothetical protein
VGAWELGSLGVPFDRLRASGSVGEIKKNLAFPFFPLFPLFPHNSIFKNQ